MQSSDAALIQQSGEINIDGGSSLLCKTYNHDPDEKEDIAGQQDKDWDIVDDVVNLLDLGEEGTLVYLVHVDHLPLLWVSVRR